MLEEDFNNEPSDDELDRIEAGTEEEGDANLELLKTVNGATHLPMVSKKGRKLEGMDLTDLAFLRKKLKK